MKKTINLLLTLVIISALIFSLTACKNKANQYVGEYNGTSGSYLNLHEDGTCIYAQTNRIGTGTGTWELKDNMLIVNAENLGYPIYAEIDFDDKGFYFTSDHTNWEDEYFAKSN